MKSIRAIIIILAVAMIPLALCKSGEGPGQSRTDAVRPGPSIPTFEQIKEIQRFLKSKGFYTGDIDGDWRGGTMDGVKLYWNQESAMVYIKPFMEN